ncbi:MAG: DUF547 domain-containing protein [Thermoanaerobaculia bacterium]|nr:DUF547 domain-containing protein [Thermoanaerobaculia bacterium]
MLAIARWTLVLAIFLFVPGCGEIESEVDAPLTVSNHKPGYTEYARLLRDYVIPGRGVDYAGLKSNDSETLRQIRQEFAKVDVSALSHDEKLAYWINVYNANVLGIVVEHYPIDSIRDISTDPVRQLNVFEQPLVPAQGEKVSLDTVEHEEIRGEFDEPRIHFAVNCAAESCPPIRPEPFVGERLDEQLDQQTRRFLRGPQGVRLEQRADTLVVHTTKIMDWFREDFEKAGGIVDFIMPYLEQPARIEIATAETIEIEFDDYSWALNDASRRE